MQYKLDRSKLGQVIIVIILFSLSFIPRILLLSKGPFHFDTVDLLMEMRDKALTSHGATFVLPSSIVIVLAYIKDILAPRISDLKLLLVFTVFVSSLSIVTIFQVFKKIFGTIFSFTFALLISFFPLYFSITTYGRIDYAFVFLLLPCVIYYCIKQKWIPCALYTGLAISCRPEIIFLLPAFLVYITFSWFEYKKCALKNRILGIIRDFLVIALISTGLWLTLSLVLGREKWFQFMVLKIILPQFSPNKPVDMLVVLGRFNFNNILDGLKLVFQLMSLPLILSVAGLIKQLWQKKYKEAVLFLIPFIILFLLVVNLETYESRYLVVPVFFLIYFSCAGIIAVFKKPRIATLFTALCAVLMFSTIMPVVYARHMEAYQVDFAKFTEKVTEPDSVIITQDEWIFLKYYTSKEFLIPPSGCDIQEWNRFFDKINAILDSGRLVYLTSTGLSYDRCLIFRNYIESNFYVKPIGSSMVENWHRDINRHTFKEKILLLVPSKWLR